MVIGKMSNKELACLYDKNHIIPIFKKGSQVEERNLNITVNNVNDSLQVKLRDPLDFCFNYTENIDLGDFEVMRMNQSLDINFNEFRCNLIELLQQFHKKEMFLKCETSDQKCTLVFYGKSKIKSLVFLTVDLHMTNQKDIFSELISNMQEIQGTNERLKKQLSNVRKSVTDKDQQIQQLHTIKTQLESQFHNNLRQLDDLFNAKIKEVENILISKIILNKQRLMKLLQEVEVLKREAVLKADSSTRLVRSMENLRLEAVDNAALINQLKQENKALHSTKFNHEKNLADLTRTLQDKEASIVALQKINDELRADVEKAAIALSQKKVTIEELSKDLVQANQMLVNFNKHYDNKAKHVEELLKALANQEQCIKEHRIKTNDILSEFNEYKAMFNSEGQEKLKHELFLANNKVQELEKSIRKANKINTLLTEKVNQKNLGFNNA